MGEVEADRRHHGEAELALAVDWIIAGESLERRFRQPLLLHIKRFRHEFLEEGLEIGEDRRDVGGTIAGIVLLHQRVIRVEPGLLGPHLRFLAHQRDHVFERRQEACPVVLRAKVAPELLGAHARRGLALDELDRQAGQIGVVAAELPRAPPAGPR